MALRLNNFNLPLYKTGRCKREMALITMMLFSVFSFSQEDHTKPPKVDNFKADSSYANYNELRFDVAKAQIISLKNGGALLVRLKTNANTINRLKAAGNMDLATQVERETQLNNKAIIRAYTHEFKFCPVYFFNSDCSDSVKYKKLAGIFVDSNLVLNPSIVCNAPFYLVAEQGSIYDSSLGLVSESQAGKAVERGTPSKEVFIAVKNRYFIQLHKPFPYYQQGYSIKKYSDYVKKFNAQLTDFYKKSSAWIIPSEVKEYVY